MSQLFKTIVGCLIISIWGCSTVDKVLPDYRNDYKKSKTMQALEVPPDLINTTNIDEEFIIPEKTSKDNTTSFSNSERKGTTKQASLPAKDDVLPLSTLAQVKYDDGTRWLYLQGEPSNFWPKIKQFWLENGFILKIDQPNIGIMETKWAKNRTDIPQNGIRKLFGKVFDAVYSASTRDKFRVRLERGEVAGTTNVYITHRGAEEVAKGNNFVWQNRPPDSELEVEMLNRIMVFIGIEKKQADTLLAKKEDKKEDKDKSPVAKSKSKSKLVNTKDGQVNLIVYEDFARAWRHSGQALEHIGFNIQDMDRTSGAYFVNYIDSDIDNNKQGFLARFFGGSKPDAIDNDSKYMIRLKDESPNTRIVVLNSDGKTFSPRKTAEKILTMLHEQLQ